jgi:hypothetical protein
MAEKWQILAGAPLAVVGEVVFDRGVTTYRSLGPHGEYFLRMVSDVVTSPETYVALPDGRMAGGPHDNDAARLSAALAQVNEEHPMIEVRGRLENPQRTVPPVPPLDSKAKTAVSDALIAALAKVPPASRSKIEARARAIAEAVQSATTGEEVSNALRTSYYGGVSREDPIVEFISDAIDLMSSIPDPVGGRHPLRGVIESFATAFRNWLIVKRPPVQ